MSDNETSRSHHDHHNMVSSPHHDHTLGHLLRLGAPLQRRPRRHALHGGLARQHGRRFILSNRQHGVLLHSTPNPNHYVLRSHLDQGVEEEHPHRHQGCADGTFTTKIEGEGGQNACCCRDSLCAILASIVRDFCEDKIGR